MASLRGERFQIDLSSDEEDAAQPVRPPDANAPALLVKDIQERSSTQPKSPSAPQPRSNQSGFPAHKTRVPQSKFKAQRSVLGGSGLAEANGPRAEQLSTRQTSQFAGSIQPQSDLEERRAIDQENNQRIAQMSDEDIAQEREELMSRLDPTILQKLLQRARIDDTPQQDNGDHIIEHKQTLNGDALSAKTIAHEAVDRKQPSDTGPQDMPMPIAGNGFETQSIHFPRPPQPPDLDPEAPSFFDDLHQKYFPSLSSEPSKLDWMRTSPDSAYTPNQASVNMKDLRFDFKGALIAPRTAASIPVTAGLHHHGDAPDSAGYTVPELCHLSRSSVPMQRCIALQTLGRLMFRLGSGGFGQPEEQIPKGVWKMLEEGRVLDTLQAAANSEGGHMSVKAHAVEALWLWRKGGNSTTEAN